LRRRTSVRVLAILLAFGLLLGTVRLPAARAQEVNLPPLPPGVPAEGWDELGLILNLYTTLCGQYSSKAPVGAKLDASKQAIIMFNLSKLISMLPGPA